MISEDGCLVLCLKTAPPGQGLLQTQGTHPGTGLGEKVSVRSNMVPGPKAAAAQAGAQVRVRSRRPGGAARRRPGPARDEGLMYGPVDEGFVLCCIGGCLLSSCNAAAPSSALVPRLFAPSHPVHTPLQGAGEAARGLPGPRGPNNPPSRTQPAAEAAAGRATELLPDASAALPPLGPGGGAAASAAAQRQQPESGAAAGAGTQGQGSGSGASGGDPGIVNATLPRKPDGKNPLFVARSTLESIYGPGPVQLPLPVIVRFQIGDELDPQVRQAGGGLARGCHRGPVRS